VLKLSNAMARWGTADFEDTLKSEIEQLSVAQLPLQQALSSSSYALDQPFQVMVNAVSDRGAVVGVKAGIFYAGTVAGCSCADDPTPAAVQPEYCELEFIIDKQTGAARVRLLSED
jgi:hypothetical protein